MIEPAQAPEAAKLSGHGGGDYFEIVGFVESTEGNHPPMVGIHKATDMTLPGLISQQFAANDGEWTALPDSRDW